MDTHNKMVIAIIQETDYNTTVDKLNSSGFFVTKLSSSGGFLRKKNSTILISVEESKVQEVLDIIKTYAGRRIEKVYTIVTAANSSLYTGIESSVPVDTEVGGATVFVMDIDNMAKY